MDGNAIEKIKKTVKDSSNDVIIIEFLQEMIKREENGLHSFRSTYRKMIQKYSNNWDGNNEI